jgi:predicted Zn-dependent protease
MQQGRFDSADGVVTNLLNKIPDNLNAIAIRDEIKLALGKADEAVNTLRDFALVQGRPNGIAGLIADDDIAASTASTERRIEVVNDAKTVLRMTRPNVAMRK